MFGWRWAFGAVVRGQTLRLGEGAMLLVEWVGTRVDDRSSGFIHGCLTRLVCCYSGVWILSASVYDCRDVSAIQSCLHGR
jgi:hypothetical protein